MTAIAQVPSPHPGGRDVCTRCWRPVLGCYCAHITPIETRTRLVLLQHPRERYVAIGTARMASLCLTNSELHVGLDWSRDAALARALSDAERPPILLYPGEGSIDIVKDPPPGPVTLVVVDGTWAQTKKVVRINPVLAKLPRYAFVPPQPSEYRIRKEPDDASVATIEALVHALTALEGDEARFATLLRPFRAMIDFQIDCEKRFCAARTRHAKHRSRPRRSGVPRVFDDRAGDILCVAAEANSWPYSERDGAPADELVLWAAYRPSTGETMSYVVAPNGPIAPGTPLHTRIEEPSLRSGGTLAELDRRWRAFARDTDVVCSWGRYETSLFVESGGWLPKERVDLRCVARDVVRGKVGSLAEYRDSVVDSPADGDERARYDDVRARVPGRGGDKLASIAAIIAKLKTLAND